jgi:MFS transporter, DHA2 family, methylenomycin A resistance protein
MITAVSMRHKQTSHPARNALGLAGMCLGTALIVMEANVVNVAIPTIRADFRAGPATVLWAVDAYTLVFAALLLSGGRLGQRIGTRRAYLAGLAVFAAASVAAGFAPAAGVLVAARAAQGVGAALLAPAPLTLITRAYTEPAERARAVAIWVSVGGVAFMVGPLLSGVLVQTIGWRSIFFLNVPVSILTAGLLLAYVPETTRQRSSFDPLGQLLAVIGLAGVVWGLVESSLDGWASWPVLGGLVGGIAVLAAFLISQRRGAQIGRHVLLPPPIIASPRVVAGLLAGFVYNFTLYGMLIVYTFDFQRLRHLTPLATGVAFLPLTAVATATSATIGGRFAYRFGPRASIAVGMAICAAGLAVLSIGATSAPYPLLAFGLATFAFGENLVAPAQTLTVMSFTPDEHKNMGSGALNTARQTGGVIGVALLGAIATSHPSQGTPIAMGVAVIACLTALVAALKLLPARTR